MQGLFDPYTTGERPVSGVTAERTVPVFSDEMAIAQAHALTRQVAALERIADALERLAGTQEEVNG